MQYVLGISACYHDSAAVLLGDGEILAAAQEERFTRIKGDAGFPHNSLAYCLNEAGIDLDDVDQIVFYENPLEKFGRLLQSHLAVAPRSLRGFLAAMPKWLSKISGWKKSCAARWAFPAGSSFATTIFPTRQVRFFHHLMKSLQFSRSMAQGNGQLPRSEWYLFWWISGAHLLAFGLIYPLCLQKASDLFRFLTGKLGRLIFCTLLTLIYFVFVLPFGLLSGKSSPAQPFASWSSGEKAHGFAWHPKVVNTMTHDRGVAGLGGTFYAVLRYFVERGQWFLLPLVVLLLVAGLLLFFAQTSTIAPFIYTLF